MKRECNSVYLLIESFLEDFRKNIMKNIAHDKEDIRKKQNALTFVQEIKSSMEYLSIP